MSKGFQLRNKVSQLGICREEGQGVTYWPTVIVEAAEITIENKAYQSTSVQCNIIPRSLSAWPRPRAPSMRASMAVIICTKLISPLTISVAPYLQKVRKWEGDKGRREEKKWRKRDDKTCQRKIKLKDMERFCPLSRIKILASLVSASNVRSLTHQKSSA